MNEILGVRDMINFKQFIRRNRFLTYGLPFVVCCLLKL